MGAAQGLSEEFLSAACGAWDVLGRHGCGFASVLAGTQAGEPEVPSYGMLLLKTVLALAAVCVLAYVVLRWGLRWIVPGSSRYLNEMKVLDRQVLEGRRCLYLVEVGKRGYLLAMTDTAVSVVAEYGPEELEAIVDAARQKAKQGSAGRARSFLETLFSGRKGGGPGPADRDEDTGKDAGEGKGARDG